MDVSHRSPLVSRVRPPRDPYQAAPREARTVTFSLALSTVVDVRDNLQLHFIYVQLVRLRPCQTKRDMFSRLDRA